MIEQYHVLNLIPGYGEPVIVHASQYDADSRDMVFALYNGDTVFNVPDNAVVTCDGTKSDNLGFSYVADSDGNLVTVKIKDQMTVFSGSVECQLTITQGDSVLGTANFIIDVERAALGDDTNISESDYPAFTQLAQDAAKSASEAKDAAANVKFEIEDAEGGVNQAIQNANAAKEQLNSAIDESATAWTNLVNATNEGNTTITNLENATSSGDETIGNLEVATTDANTAKDALSQPTADAQAAKTALDTANQTAADNLEALNDSAAMAQKIPKVSPAVAGNLAALKADGTLLDSGKKPGDFAPSGYGLGESAETDYESMIGSGFIYSGSGQPDGNGAWGYQVQHTGEYGSQIVCAYDGTQRQRVKSQGTIGEWEWVNPPMYAGIEYRTTERWSGAVVYTKLVDCGLSASSKTVSSGVPTTAEIIRDAVVVGGQPMTQRADDDIIGSTRLYSKVSGIWQIQLTSGSSGTGRQIYVQMWYIK